MVVLILCVFILLYVLYYFQLPTEQNYDDYASIFGYIAFVAFVCTTVFSCNLFKFVKELRITNPIYARAVLLEGIVLISANIIAGIFNWWLADGEIITLLGDRDNGHIFVFTAILVPYFVVTEFLPSIVIARTLTKFSELLTQIAL